VGANTDRRLKSEMLVTARVREKLVGVVVPATAITLEGRQHVVYVQVQPGVYEPRRVTLGYLGNKEVVLTAGLEVGEQVVADNALLLAREFAVANEDAGKTDTGAPVGGAAAAGTAQTPAKAN